MRRDVQFSSEGVKCAGWLWVPDDLTEPAPAIVMANAFSAVKEIYLSTYAERFCAAGFVTLAFDYRSFGESDGEPRCQVFPQNQVDDVRNAVSWLREQPEVDPARIGAWGVSLGGGHVMYLSAFDERIKATVAVIPAINQWENLLSAMPREALFAFLRMLTDDRQARYGGGPINYMTLVAPPGEQAMMPEEAYHFYTEAQQTIAPNWQNRVTMESLERFVEYNPTGPIDLISPTPLMMVIAEQDSIIPAAMATAAFERALEPKELVVLPCQHTAVYNVEPWVTESVDAAVRWFTTHLSGS